MVTTLLPSSKHRIKKMIVHREYLVGLTLFTIFKKLKLMRHQSRFLNVDRSLKGGHNQFLSAARGLVKIDRLVHEMTTYHIVFESILPLVSGYGMIIQRTRSVEKP